MTPSRVFLPAVLFLASCHGFHGTTAGFRHIVFVPDATASIAPFALDQAMQAIEVQADQLRHGDCITVIPIIGDSDSVPSDLIVRKCVPLERQSYDQEMTDFRSEVHHALSELTLKLNKQHAQKTDILGTIKMTNQEFALDGLGVRKTLFIFSDFIQEDGYYDFTKSPDLASSDSAERLAQSLARKSISGCGKTGNLAHVNVLLGNLQSTELPRLSPQRRAAIQQFWIAYLTACNAKPFFANDGPGVSSRFLSQGD